jgi:adenosylcobinamide-GDP ribazoletransferase
MWLLPSASDDGLGARYSNRVGRRQAGVAVLLGIGTAIALLGVWGLIAAAIAGVSVAAVGALAMRKIGGITGDALGAVEQLVEIGTLLLASAIGASIPWWRH